VTDAGFIEIKGVHFANQGAHLMLLAVLERLVPAFPGMRPVLSRGPNSPAVAIAGHGAWEKQKLRKRSLDLNSMSYIWPAAADALLNRRHRVAEGQVQSIVDASGYAYGGSWSPWLMAYAASEIERLATHDKAYVFLPQAFGPFRRGPAVSRFAAALQHAALVCVRDSQSAHELLEISPQLVERVMHVPDCTIAVGGRPEAAGRWGVDLDTVLLVPNVHMMDDRNPDRAWRGRYVGFLAELAAQLGRGGSKAMVLKHELRLDDAISRQVAVEAGGLPVIHETDPRCTKGVIGAAGAVVSSRFHACLSALSQGVPCLGTAWSHKYPELYRDFGVDGWLLEEPSASTAAELLTRILGDRPAHRAALLRATGVMRERIDSMWVRVISAIGQGGVGGARR
jgi:polysaccharide pyruvyl transferase WcaK-like protein